MKSIQKSYLTNLDLFFTMLELKFDYREAWRKWLHDNHDKEDEVWLIFKKKGTQPVTFNYQEALEEALCYGWIDSLVRRINETMYMRKFTPRKTSSIWSATNKKHAEILIQSGRMAGPGMRKIQDAKKNGQWDRKMERPEVSDEIPGALLHAFMTNPLARDNYQTDYESECL